jgi:small subunit ribosomal protein S35
MAASINRLGYLALRYTPRIPSRKKVLPLIVPSRALHTTNIYRQNDDSEPSAETKPFDFLSSLDHEGRTYYDTLSPEEKIKFEQVAHKLDEHMTSPEVVSDLNAQTSQAAYNSQTLIKSMESLDLPEKIKPGLFAMGEVDPQDTGEDEEFDGDDMSSVAHGQLEQHREFREYARIAAWEMPLLSSMFLPILFPA